LSAVQQYAKTTAAASASFDALSDDYYRTCLRRREYSEPATVGGESLAAETPTRPTPIPAPSPGATPQPASTNGDDSQCQSSSSLAYRWQLENDVVVDYVRALGEVAGVDTAPKNFDTLASALKNAGVIGNDATATAAGNLAAAVGNALIAARQRAAVRQIVQAAHDGGLGQVVSALQFTADEYRVKLQLEHTAVQSYYTTVLGNEQREFAVLECSSTTSARLRQLLNCQRYPVRPPGRGTSLALVAREARASELRDLMKRQRLERVDSFTSLAQHAKAAIAYREAVGAIASGNDALLKIPGNDAQSLAVTIKPYVDLLQDKVAAMVAALRK
jgi:hypothetical protein